jgi:hypothetical protein
LANKISRDFANDTRFFYYRSIEIGEFISNVGISNEAQTLGHRRQLMESSERCEPVVEAIHLAFPHARPESSSDI